MRRRRSRGRGGRRGVPRVQGQVATCVDDAATDMAKNGPDRDIPDPLAMGRRPSRFDSSVANPSLASPRRRRHLKITLVPTVVGPSWVSPAF
ncbi:hypothetical protein TIFTF001_026739 [Ficus carica]|uniref:Uncharacterized protein n=1 Tax=Ficus carica TaxID=3494 RepID=A0AA88DM11_FICCA|nr:hypothetical protein TIFTF001_026739 [Ficus carica]